MKYNSIEKRELHSKYYDEDGFVRIEIIDGKRVPLKKKDGLYSKWSETTDQIKEDNDYVFDILEVDGKDCIRFNMTEYDGCGCKYILTEIEAIKRLHKFLSEYLEERGEI